MRAKPLVAFRDRREPIHGDLDAAIRAATIPECDKELVSHLVQCQRIGLVQNYAFMESGGAVEVRRTINRQDGGC